MKKKIITIATILLIITTIVILRISTLHTPYVATEGNNGLTLTYKGELYIYIGDKYEAREIVGIDIELGRLLGEVKPNKFDLGDFLLTNHPIQSIKGNEQLNFIAKPEWQSPSRIYCKKKYYDRLNSNPQ